MGIASTVGKVALKGGKLLSRGNIVTFLASFVVAELLSRAMEDAAGDPEAAVASILRAGQKQAQIKASMATTQSAEVKEAVGKSFQGIRPDQRLTDLALMKRGAMNITPDDTPVLSFISSKLGVNPQRLMQLSNPSRMGDFSELQTVLRPDQREQ